MDESSNQTTASTSGSNKNNTTTIMIAVVVVLVLLLAGGVFAFRHQLKTMLMPESVQTENAMTTEENKETAEPPAPTPTNPNAMKESTTGAAMMAKMTEVDYTATGFSPKSVTIKKGEIVKFVNKSGSPMSVASNPHPTHTDYPEFQQYLSAFKGKDEYDFTFTKVGSWGFHNHMNPTDGGTVVVME